MDDSESRVSFKKVPQAPFKKLYGDSLRINRQDYKLIFCKELHLDGKQYAGLCASHYKTIYVDVDYDNVESTLLHEIIHAEICEGGFRQRPDWSLEKEEMLCEIMAEGLTRNFRIRKK